MLDHPIGLVLCVLGVVCLIGCIPIALLIKNAPEEPESYDPPQFSSMQHPKQK